MRATDASPRTIPGRALVCASRYNEAVGRRLVDGALAALANAGYGADRVDVAWVTGAFELPLVLDQALRTGRYDVAVAVGAVIRGETPHFEYIAQETTRGIGAVALARGVPIGFGLLTCDTLEQAIERSGGAAGNKGREAVDAALNSRRVIGVLAGDASA
jgi:6,7-dimethyl-8-ribityllumazine synthase